MRAGLPFVLILLAAALAVAAPPWLALHEARRQAYAAEAGLALNYARDVLHRNDETLDQAQHAINQVERTRYPPCSPSLVALMRRIDLTSSYVQAIGHVRGDLMECSSIGGAPVPLGKVAFRTAHGVTLYPAVPLAAVNDTPLLGLARDGVVVLVHRDLALDIWTATPDVTLALVQLEQQYAYMVHGRIDPRWPARIDGQDETSFVDGDRLVAIVRSPRYPTTAAIAAVPAAELDKRITEFSRRLVPAGLFGGLAAAAAIVLLARQRMSIGAAMRAGLRRGEFFLLYQPLVDLKSGACVGVEALLRWRRGDGETVGPELFIPIAEQSGMITRLTEHMLELVDADTGQFLATHPQFHVGINLSPADLHTPAVVEHIDAVLARNAAHPSNLIVEITERGFLDLALARGVIAELRARGIAVAIDDFGTGYSSLSYLESLDLDYLKIDRSFIEAIGTGAPTSQVVGHIIAMARALGLAMIAEGVESEAQHAFLRAHGVQFAQGWLFGHPMPFADVVRALRTQATARAGTPKPA
jgi:sensor c-di-GMP phosphodiesterase-like protein